MLEKSELVSDYARDEGFRVLVRRAARRGGSSDAQDERCRRFERPRSVQAEQNSYASDQATKRQLAFIKMREG